nr:MAG TPA: hypothetical protein [Caudoviricetes sp.]
MQGRVRINKHTYCLDNGCAYGLRGVVHMETS